MPEPIIVDGHAEKVTITVPSQFKLTNAGNTTTIEVEADPGKPFQRVEVKEDAVLKFSNKTGEGTDGFKANWHIEIGRHKTEI